MIPCQRLGEAPVTALDERRSPWGGAHRTWAPAEPGQEGPFEATPRANGANLSAVGAKTGAKGDYKPPARFSILSGDGLAPSPLACVLAGKVAGRLSCRGGHFLILAVKAPDRGRQQHRKEARQHQQVGQHLS
ncbi:hypothetical protein SAMN02745177_01825 [Desulforamulus hydrothermalis Lam5 = DSM 18033]|nr:hypothetical protein SAMN02745177_01825 [Desulforamulus hydrothermalis Lam5 = DSM 18033]